MDAKTKTMISVLAPLLVAANTETPVSAESPAEAVESCEDRPDPFARDECENRNVARREARLEQAYSAAYRFVTEREATALMEDRRRSPIHLDWAQAAWRHYVEQDCTVRAGLLGGANIWVSRQWRTCYSGELDRRIAFLEDVASGRFTAP